MEREAQFDVLLDLLRKFDREGILRNMMLIGSWCLFFYRSALWENSNLPVIRTLDADFLIPNPSSLKRDVDVSAILKEMGFVPTFYRSSDWIVYDHPELRVEFLIPELGKGHDKAQEIKKLHVKAQRLRYLNLLAEHPRSVSYGGLSLCVPEPAAFALHKLIVSSRRTNELKRGKDLDSAIALLDYILLHPKERGKMGTIVKGLPKRWLKTINDLAGEHYPRLAEVLKDFQ